MATSPLSWHSLVPSQAEHHLTQEVQRWALFESIVNTNIIAKNYDVDLHDDDCDDDLDTNWKGSRPLLSGAIRALRIAPSQRSLADEASNSSTSPSSSILRHHRHHHHHHIIITILANIICFNIKWIDCIIVSIMITPSNSFNFRGISLAKFQVDCAIWSLLLSSWVIFSVLSAKETIKSQTGCRKVQAQSMSGPCPSQHLRGCSLCPNTCK